MKHIQTVEGKGIWLKKYDNEKEYRCNEVIDNLIGLGYKINYIQVSEDSDMPTVADVYSLDSFVSNFKFIMKYDVTGVKVNFDYFGVPLTLSMSFKGREFLLITPENNIGLGNVFEKKNKTKHVK